jgi:hypothetical protein
VASNEGFLEISCKPNPFLHLVALQEWFSLLNKLICPHLDVLIEEVTSEYLLSVLEVEQVGRGKQETESGFGCEL